VQTNLCDFPPVLAVEVVIGALLVSVGLHARLDARSAGYPDPLIFVIPPITVVSATRRKGLILVGGGERSKTKLKTINGEPDAEKWGGGHDSCGVTKASLPGRNKDPSQGSLALLLGHDRPVR